MTSCVHETLKVKIALQQLQNGDCKVQIAKLHHFAFSNLHFDFCIESLRLTYIHV